MTSKLTREERVQSLYGLKIGQVLNPSDIESIKMLARMALAAMDSEPDCNERKLFCSTDTARMRKVISVSAGSEATPLHRHAQPAPVVPEEKPIPNTLSMYAVDAVAAIAEVKGWNACRAAMLQAKSLTTINPAPTLVSLPKNAKSLTGNSPGIPDGYVMVPVEPNGDMLAAAQDAYGETDGDIASTLRAAMLSGGKS
ncbi:hypothetical protein HVY29_15085 [Klebsiella pneumoniae]|nr:hypothetical protein [Klebsiella pneumoniae]PLO06265.1 hypothetical protein CWN46_22910 [Klebsiella pneumoniae]QMH61244.1 hypothetical protein HVY29_15085 [Klebsiella pneumoniae]